VLLNNFQAGGRGTVRRRKGEQASSAFPSYEKQNRR